MGIVMGQEETMDIITALVSDNAKQRVNNETHLVDLTCRWRVLLASQSVEILLPLYSTLLLARCRVSFSGCDPEDLLLLRLESHGGD